MKKFLLESVMVLLCLCAVVTSNAQSKTAVKFNAAAFVGVINPSIEFKVHDNITVQLDPYGCFHPTNFMGTGNPLTISMTFFEGRYYFKEAFKGFYVGPHAGWGVWRMNKGIAPNYRGTYVNEYQVGSNAMLGATFGYHFSFNDHWGCELSWGGGWSGTQYEGHRRSDGSMYVGWNGSGEWLPIYKGALNIVYKW